MLADLARDTNDASWWCHHSCHGRFEVGLIASFRSRRIASLLSNF